jgi:hypothetical protein
MRDKIWFWFKYELPRLQEKAWMWIAWHLPKTLVMWCYIRLAARATTGEYDTTNPTELNVMEALKRWEG